eukprot:m.26337 g.26337  ORF g.26337 m.26337 type:complete len:1074 (+) comp8929_c1_seq1:17-3238(+)
MASRFFVELFGLTDSRSWARLGSCELQTICFQHVTDGENRLLLCDGDEVLVGNSTHQGITIKRVHEAFVALRLGHSPAVFGANFLSTPDCDRFLDAWDELRRGRTDVRAAPPLTPVLRSISSNSVFSKSESEPDTPQPGNVSTSSIPSLLRSDSASSPAPPCSGPLVCKHLLARTRSNKVVAAARRGWIKYHAVLRGSVLILFHSKEDLNAVPAAIISLEHCLAVPLADHSKREFIFSLAVANGNVYLMQATSAADCAEWVRGIHATASIWETRSTELRTCQRELERMSKAVEKQLKTENDLKRMAELQMTMAGLHDDVRGTLQSQVAAWEKSLEAQLLESFRLQCYLDAVLGARTAVPARLLTALRRVTSERLLKLNAPHPAGAYAVIMAEAAEMEVEALNAARRKGQSSLPPMRRRLGTFSKLIEEKATSEQAPQPTILDDEQFVRIAIRGAGSTVISRVAGMTAGDVISAVCARRGTNPRECFLRALPPSRPPVVVPDQRPLLEKVTDYELVPKTLHDVILTKLQEVSFGFTMHFKSPSCLLVQSVLYGGIAQLAGLRAGDEIVAIGGRAVEGRSADLVAMLRACTSIALTVRPASDLLFQVDPALKQEIDSFVREHAPPPLSSTTAPCSREALLALTIPPPPGCPPADHDGAAPVDVQSLIARANEVTRLASCPAINGSSSEEKESDAFDKTRKILVELVVTEAAYVTSLRHVLMRFIVPLAAESFLTRVDRESLASNLPRIVVAQTLFYRQLQLAVLEASGADTTSLNARDGNERPDTLKALLLALPPAGVVKLVDGICTVVSAAHDCFRLYTEYCANHASALQVLSGSTALQAWADARNPSGELSTALSSHLIRPVQRILKYPLLLRELTASLPEEARVPQIQAAMQTVVTAANHINDMTKLVETFGSELAAAIPGYRLSLNIGSLMAHGETTMLAEDKTRTRRDASCYLLVLPETIFLFEARKDRKGKGSAYKLAASILAETAELCDAPDTDAADRVLLWGLREAPVVLEDGTQDNGRLFTFRAATISERSQFVRAIQAAASNKRAVTPGPTPPRSPGVRTSLVEV